MSEKLVQLYNMCKKNDFNCRGQLSYIMETWFLSNESNYNVSVLFIENDNVASWNGKNLKDFVKEDKTLIDIFMKIQDEFDKINTRNNNFILVSIVQNKVVTDIFPKSYKKFWPNRAYYEWYKHYRNNRILCRI